MRLLQIQELVLSVVVVLSLFLGALIILSRGVLQEFDEELLVIFFKVSIQNQNFEQNLIF